MSKKVFFKTKGGKTVSFAPKGKGKKGHKGKVRPHIVLPNGMWRFTKSKK